MFAATGLFVPSPLPDALLGQGPKQLQKGLPFGAAQYYPDAMKELPASYMEYLAAQTESVKAAVRPVLQQSAADELHGVRVTYNSGSTGHQAHIDDTLPYGVVFEDID